MSNKETGGSAFPSPMRITEQGMTLRDYFAAKAMQAYCSRKDWTNEIPQDETAKIAYSMADAMIKARNAN